MGKYLAVNLRSLIIWILLFVEIIFFTLMAPSFLSVGNILALLQNSSEIAIVGIGMTLVIILAGIDLTVGASLGVLAIITGWMIQANLPPILILLTVLVIGMSIGMLNGIVITLWNIPDIIASIGMMYILRALVFTMLNGQWLTGIPDVLGGISKNKFLFLPILFWILVLLYISTSILLNYTRLGKSIYAIGSNKKTAELIGIKINLTRILCYGFLGALTGFASVLYISRLGSVEITIGLELPIQVIAAVIIGGTSILGGRGSVIGTFAGVFFMSVMRNGINLMGIPSLWERVIVGIFILFSVSMDMLSHKRN